MALFDCRVFRAGDEWWVAQVHGGHGVGVGREPPLITDETVYFTSMGNEERTSLVSTIPAGWLNQISHESLVRLLHDSDDFGHRMEMDPYNAPDADQLKHLPVYNDSEGLRWVIREHRTQSEPVVQSIEVLCLDDSALRKDILLSAEEVFTNLRTLTGDLGPDAIIEIVKRTFRDYDSNDST